MTRTVYHTSARRREQLLRRRGRQREHQTVGTDARQGGALQHVRGPLEQRVLFADLGGSALQRIRRLHGQGAGRSLTRMHVCLFAGSAEHFNGAELMQIHTRAHMRGRACVCLHTLLSRALHTHTHTHTHTRTQYTHNTLRPQGSDAHTYTARRMLDRRGPSTGARR
jgi:hypothetical protein